MTDEPHASGPAAGWEQVNAFRAPPGDEPSQSAASGAGAQAGRRRTLRYLGLAGSLGIALAGPRPVGLLGVVLLAGAWYGLRHVTGQRWLLVTAALWAVPLLAAPPLFSGDAAAYACQGQLLVHGLNPYHHGVADLPCSWLGRVPKLWWHTPAPYGPLWVAISGAAAASGNLWLAVGVLRLVAVGGIALAVGYGRRFGLDPAWLAAGSPLVLLHGVSGAHNDALLAGLVVAGLALARDARWGVLAGAVLGLAVAVKVTALVAVPFAVLYAPRRAWAGVAAGTTAAFAAVTVATGLGVGWLAALRHTADLTQWTSPPTGVGMAAGYLLRAAGRADLAPVALAAARAAGLVVLAAVLVVLWRRRQAGAALAATAVLGPVFFPWYLLPALAVLAATTVHRDRLGLVVAVLAVLVLPDGTGLAALTKPVGAFLDVALVSAAVVVLVRRHRAGRARPTPTAP